MALAADDGSRLHFEEFRTQLAGTPLPPQLLAEFEVHVGRGYKLFGEPALAREWLDRALVTAVTHSLNQLVFQIEEAMGDTANVQGTRTMGVSTPASIPEAVEHIAEQLRSLRERAVLVTE